VAPAYPPYLAKPVRFGLKVSEIIKAPFLRPTRAWCLNLNVIDVCK